MLFSIPAGITLIGLPYYMLGHAARLRSPLHPVLRPSGPVGLAFGVAAFAMFLFLWLYPLRKRARWLAWTGAVGRWLDVHIVCGLMVPLAAAVHAGWRFEGLIGLGYLSMAVVSASGVVGRYLYTHIPRRRNGLEMTRDEIAAERRGLVTEIAAATRIEPHVIERALASGSGDLQGLGPLATVRALIADDLERRRVVRALERRLRVPGGPGLERGAARRVLALARREVRLGQQVRALEATRRLFAWWHVAHRPFAITALLAVLLHVAVALALGAVGAG
uniref:Uncharacterized protein n=1 Tax=Eiseniibacteriota bacterium TaxID=2212470 RepID=A0A832I3N8_UNCEI